MMFSRLMSLIVSCGIHEQQAHTTQHSKSQKLRNYGRHFDNRPAQVRRARRRNEVFDGGGDLICLMKAENAVRRTHLERTPMAFNFFFVHLFVVQSRKSRLGVRPTSRHRDTRDEYRCSQVLLESVLGLAPVHSGRQVRLQ